MKLKFCGAAKDVTGSQHLVTTDHGLKILLDCGLYQGNDDDMATFNNEWLIDPKEIDILILSHAHIDHTGRVPKLVKDRFDGPIICTSATRSLCSIMLADSAFIQEKEAEWHNKKSNHKIQPLYTVDDANLAMNQMIGLGYGKWYPIADGVKVIFQDAGHILGSASVVLEIQEHGMTRTLGFSGDIGRPNRPILKDPVPMIPCDYVICESTYGDKLHETPPNEIERLLFIIKETCVQKKGKLIIPAFSVGRTQEIVYMLDQLQTAGRLPKIPVYVDSPLAVNATDIFQLHPECFDEELLNYMRTDDNPFGFNNLKYIRSADESKELNVSQEPCIIISASGMITAGRIKHHVFHSIANERNTVLIVGYCAPMTYGAMLRDGVPSIKMFNEVLPVKATIEVMDSFSAHADRDEMTKYLQTQLKAKKIFLVHGVEERQEKFKSHLLEKGFKAVEIPDLGSEWKLRD